MSDAGGRGRPPGAASGLELERVRRLIERGLERYGRGQLDEAIAEWEHALMLDEHNAEARNLIAFVRDKIIARGMGDTEFAESPRTDGSGRTGWGLAQEPPPRPEPSLDTPRPEPASLPVPPAAAPGSARAVFAWGGHGRVEPIGIPGEPVSDPGPPPGDATIATGDRGTDPGPDAIRSHLDELDFSSVNPADRSTPHYVDAVPTPQEGGESQENPPAQRSRRQTLRSAIPAMLAASMPEHSGPLDIKPWDAEPGSPEMTIEGRTETTRPVGGVAPVEPISSPGSPISSDALHFTDIAEDPSAAARRRAAEMVDRARAEFDAGSMEAAAEAAEFALSEGERAPPPGIAEVIEPARPLFHRVFEAHVGPGQGVPTVSLTAHEISAMTFDHRTGFLLSRIDGTLTIEELMDVSSMGGFETFRILSSLLRSGIVSVS